MDHGGDWELDVTTLSDAELAQRLRSLGANIGPVTDSTRLVYQRKLQRWLKNGPKSHATESSALHDSQAESCHSRSQRDDEEEEEVNWDEPEPQRQLPKVTQEDISRVERIMSSDVHMPSASQRPYGTFQTTTYDFDESSVRSRYTSAQHHVTPRPSLHTYRENSGRMTASDSNTSGLRPSERQNRGASSSHRSRAVIAVLVIVAILIGIAVVYNMEPAYSVPSVTMKQ